MKTPSMLQDFFAHHWPFKLWLGGWTLGALILGIAAIAPALTTFSGWTSLLSCAVVVIVSPAVGFLIGVIAGSLILSPFYALMQRRNGGPFRAGDSVQILVGPHRGRLTTVVTPWQGTTYRVKLDEESERTFADIFDGVQLRKETAAE